MRTVILKAGILGALATLGVFGTSGEAKAYANDYCREYTRTVYIGGRAENAYGRACLQPNGDWVIVDEDLADIPDNVANVNYVIRDYNRTYMPERVVYYGQPRINIYRARPVTPAFIWYKGGHYKNGRHIVYNRNKYYRKHDGRKHGHGWHRGRGRDRDD